MRIYKYPIQKGRNAFGNFTIEMPEVFQFLDVKEQDGTAYIWAMVDETTKPKEIEFRVCATGDPVVTNKWAFIKTFHQEPFVWHLFQVHNG